MKLSLYIKYIAIAVFTFACFVVKAEQTDTNIRQKQVCEIEDKTHHRVGFNGSLTSSLSWLLEFSYHYMLNRHIGFGGSVGSWEVYYEEGWASGSNRKIDEDYNKPWNFFIRPSILLKTPALKHRACSWSVFAEPGVMLNIPYQSVCIESTPNWPAVDYDYISTTKGQWLAIDLRIGVSLDIDPCGVSVGYVISNHDVYSQYRHLSYNGISFKNFYPHKSLMQGAYISLSYNL